MKHFITLLFICASTLVAAQNATVMAVHDGDSFKVRFDDSAKTTVWVRLWGADCPEVRSNHVTANQPYGVEAGDSLRLMLKGWKVTVDTLYRDAFNRPVAKVKFQGKDITEYIISTGKGWYYPSKGMTTKTRAKLKKMQAEAQVNKLGLWGLDGEKISPSDFRKKNKPKK
jgi:endonuclease YncB( thermonuclease family)